MQLYRRTTRHVDAFPTSWLEGQGALFPDFCVSVRGAARCPQKRADCPTKPRGDGGTRAHQFSMSEFSMPHDGCSVGAPLDEGAPPDAAGSSRLRFDTGSFQRGCLRKVAF